jgi:hypothetical protein
MKTLPGQKTFVAPAPTSRDKTAATRINKQLPENQQLTAAEYAKKKAEGFKWCTLGQHFVQREKFSSSQREKDGLSSSCTEHQSQYWQDYKQRQKQKRAEPAKA